MLTFPTTIPTTDAHHHRFRPGNGGVHPLPRFEFASLVDMNTFASEMNGVTGAPNATDIGSVAQVGTPATFWILTDFSPVTWSQIATAGAGGYSQLQEEGGNIAPRTILDFVGEALTASDTGVKSQVLIAPYGSIGDIQTIDIGDTTSVGLLNRIARADHQHALPAPGAPADVDKSAAVAGAATTPARADHKHDISTAAPATTAVVIGNAAMEGSAVAIARADHQHAVAAGVPINVDKSVNAAGSASTFARSDHKHDLTTAAPGASIKAGDAAVEGGATTTVRSDHQHAVSTATAGDLALVDALAAAAGTGTTIVRGDHKHQVSTAVPSVTAKSEATAAGVGTAATVLRSDAQIQVATATPTTAIRSEVTAAAQGTAATLLRSDAQIQALTAAPVAVGLANAQGTSSALVRADHVHADVFPELMWGNDAVSGTTTTRYLTPGYDSVLAPITSVGLRLSRAGTLRNLRIHQNTGAGNGNAIVYTVRVNGVASALTVSLASTASDGSDLTHTVTVAAGDLLDIEITKALSIGTSPSSVVAILELTT